MKIIKVLVLTIVMGVVCADVGVATMADYFICSCFFHRNIYLQEYRLHVHYYDDDQKFSEDYSEVIAGKATKNSSNYYNYLTEITSVELY